MQKFQPFVPTYDYPLFHSCLFQLLACFFALLSNLYAFFRYASASTWILTLNCFLHKNPIFLRFVACFLQNIFWVFGEILWVALVSFIGNCCCSKNMGGCCSHDVSVRGRVESEVDDGEYEYDHENIDDVTYEHSGAMIRMRGSSRFVSMYTQQGKKGVNQDSMTVWEVIRIKINILHVYVYMFWILVFNDLFPLILMLLFLDKMYIFWLVV